MREARVKASSPVPVGIWARIDAFCRMDSSDDIIRRMRARALILIAIVGSMIALVGVSYDMLMHPELNLLKIVGIPAIALALLAPLIVRWTGRPGVAGVFACTMLYIGVSVMSFFENGITDYAVPILLLIPIWASLFAGVAGALSFTGLVLLSICALVISAERDWAETFVYGEGMHYVSHGFVTGITVIGIGCTSLVGIFLMMRARQDILMLLAAAEKANQAKSDFIAGTSHEIRTPLTGLIGMLELTERQTDLSDLARERVQTASQSARSLLTLIDDLLDLSKSDVGELRINPEPVDLREVFCGTVETFRALIEQKGLWLHIHAPDEPVWVSCDPVRLRQILVNYLSNATKFTDNGGIEASLLVNSVRGVSELVCFRISDTGRGISEQGQDSVFERYVQTGAADTQLPGSSGLGLAVVKNIAGLMDGRVGVKSEIGKGSVFWFEGEFPAVSPPRLPDLTEVEPFSANERPLNILVVDDNQGNRKVISALLSVFGHTSVMAENGKEALQILGQAGTVDAILLDMHMPVMNGPETLTRIRGLDGVLGDIPIIVISAEGDGKDRARYLDMGADDFVGKPFDIAEFSKALEKIALRDARD